MPLRLFRLAQLRSANLVVFLLGCATFAMWFILTLYLQQVRHLDALQTGLAFLPMTAGIVVASTLVPRLVWRAGVRAVVAAGMLMTAAGLVLLHWVEPGSSYFAAVLPGGMLAAVGMGLAVVPSTIAAVAGVSGPESGLASGLINTSRLMGGALGLAVLSTIADSRTTTQLAAGVAPAQAATDGYQLALLAGAVLCLAGAMCAVVLLRSGRTTPASTPAPPLDEALAGERVAV